MKKILMQYPLDKNNSIVFDGKLHEIEVGRLVRIDINGQEYFYMEYNDKSLKKNNMGSFLKKVDGVLCKVPLESYDVRKIGQYIADCPASEIRDIDGFLPAVIGLTKMTSIENIANNVPLKSNNITIQYPYIPGNDSINGNIHDVTPVKIIRLNINGLEYFFMEYYDHKLGHEMFAILNNSNEKLKMVPLTLYSVPEMKELITKYGVEEVNVNSLNKYLGDKPSIGLAMTMSLRDIINTKLKDGKAYIDYPLYIPYNPENPMNISDRIFRSSCRTILDGEQEYIFDNEQHGNIIEKAIREKIRDNIDKVTACESFTVEINVDIPAGTRVEVPTKDGRIVLAEYIPGIHHAEVLLTPCLDKSMDKPTRLCDRVGIKASNEEYHGYEDNAMAFKDAYDGYLPIAFYGLPFTNGMVLHNAIEKKSQRDIKIVTEDPIPKKVEPVSGLKEMMSSKAVSMLREYYVSSMLDIYELYDGVAIDDNYIVSYKENLRIYLSVQLIKLGFSKEEVNFNIVEFENELNERLDKEGKRLK